MTQAQSILRHLKAGRSITPLEALRRFGCFRLGARVYDLRRSGHRIERSLVDDGERRYARYRLAR